MGAARDGAEVVREAFLAYRAEFARLTARARASFSAGDWTQVRRDAAERLDLYGGCLAAALERLRALLGDGLHERPLWHAANRAYAHSIAGMADAELAQTFFNSVTRRVFATAGVDPAIEFVELAFPPSPPEEDVVRTCPRRHDTAGVVARLLQHHELPCGYEDLGRDATLIAADLDAASASPVLAIDSARPLFFRNRRAYVVGRVRRASGEAHPIVVPLVNETGRVAADTVLLTEDEASIVFSFTRSYFFVETAHPRGLVGFLRTLMPRKPVSDLYDAIGHNRHGKTELYRALHAHLAASHDPFEIAAGQRGMVMLVFTLPSYDLVFKVIRDRFPPPKTVTRRSVVAKYDLVFRHDRAGRLVDARSFEHIQFDRRRFPPALIDELLGEAGETVELGPRSLGLRHLYTERRMRPLDLYLREAAPAQRVAAILDYGEAIRDLARSNIFPGDMLLKNFGVTRHGRVVFYDYDELALLTDCRFREVPRARYDDEELAGEPWFFVGENDVFPEEFLPFLGLEGELRDAFMDAHRDLMSVEFWSSMQAEHRAGRVPDVMPYPASRRFAGRQNPASWQRSLIAKRT
jgi:isocitrate dehydrogenase kinase/phosphatase